MRREKPNLVANRSPCSVAHSSTVSARQEPQWEVKTFNKAPGESWKIPPPPAGSGFPLDIPSTLSLIQSRGGGDQVVCRVVLFILGPVGREDHFHR